MPPMNRNSQPPRLPVDTKTAPPAVRRLAVLTEAEKIQLARAAGKSYILSRAEIEELDALRFQARSNLYSNRDVRLAQKLPHDEREAAVQNYERFVFSMFGSWGRDGARDSIGRLGMLKSALNNVADALRTEKQKFTKDNIAILYETICRDTKYLCDILERLSQPN